METVIVDAGPLVAYLKGDDQDHDWTREQFEALRSPLLTCEAALSEAFFLLEQVHGGTGALLGLLERGVVVPAFDLWSELAAVAPLMRRYASVPMSLADACLVRMAEIYEDATVFTLDGDFRIYRKHRRQLVPILCPR